MTIIIAQRDKKITTIKDVPKQWGKMGICLEKELRAENTAQQKRVKKLEAKIEALTSKNDKLTQQILKAHAYKRRWEQSP